MDSFKLTTNFKACGDQPQAIQEISNRIIKGEKETILLGVTGSGKTFTMANVIQELQRPTLIMAPNKTLAAQLYAEFKSLFPTNAVEYFVSYYDYYQPEAYMPTTDTYIEKDASINEMIDKMRHSATASLLRRRDVIVVASVSCIYSLGAPEIYEEMHLVLSQNQEVDRDTILRQLVSMQYDRNDMDFHRGTFRVRGDVVEVFPSNENEKSIRIEFFGDEIDSLSFVDPLTGNVLKQLDVAQIFPNSHYITQEAEIKNAINSIQKELQQRLSELKSLNKLLEAQRLEQRTLYDIEMIEEIGYCQGVENYSRHFDGRKPGETPYTLLDYFPDDFILFLDESHISVPQVGGMYRGDRSRKMTLVEHGFRLPSALDNRPLTFVEFEKKIGQRVYVSATPGKYELDEKKVPLVQQIIRPTGLIDPEIIIKPAKGQVKDLLELCKGRVANGERVLITTLTKRMAEDLTEFLKNEGVKTRYLHSDVDTLERVEIIRALRKKEFDILVGINLLREGLDIPEVSLVAILDADKEGFLRSERSLIQTFGRAARNVNGQVVLYADKVTNSMSKAINETNRRREVQTKYNIENHIEPKTIIKEISDALSSADMDYYDVPIEEEVTIGKYAHIKDKKKYLEKLKKQMFEEARNLNFEEAAKLRDEIQEIESLELK